MTRIRGCRRMAAVTVAVLLVVAGCRNSAQDATPPPSSPGSTAQEQPQAPAGAAAYAPQSERRFVRVGATGGRQFTDDELGILADNFDVVLFTKFHGGYDISAQHEAARRLVALKPGIEVYPYFSTKYWFDQNKWGDATIDPAWFLRDNEGEVVNRDRRRDRDTPEDITYVDLANPEYRAWALDVFRSWLEAAPYAGISFDAAEPIGDYGEKDVVRWDRLLGPERVAAYNAGLRDLLASADRAGRARAPRGVQRHRPQPAARARAEPRSSRGDRRRPGRAVLPRRPGPGARHRRRSRPAGRAADRQADLPAHQLPGGLRSRPAQSATSASAWAPSSSGGNRAGRTSSSAATTPPTNWARTRPTSTSTWAARAALTGPMALCGSDGSRTASSTSTWAPSPRRSAWRRRSPRFGAARSWPR